MFTPVLAKHSKSFSLIDYVSVGVDRMQRNFEPMRKQVEAWQRFELTDVTAKVVIYEAFVEDKLEAPKHLASTVHNLTVRAKLQDATAHGNRPSPFRSLAIRHEDHAIVPIEIFNAHTVEFSLVSHPGIPQQDHDVTE
jgi:hypothetical protein